MDIESLAVFATAIFTGVVYLRSARAAQKPCDSAAAYEIEPSERVHRADVARTRVTALPRYIVACLAFGIAVGVLVHFVAPTVAYAILCLSLVARSVADLISEERAPRRRAALLQRSRRVDPVLLTWIGLAAISALLLAPYFLVKEDRLAAIVVAGCVVMMALVAWRIASAPPILFGNDLEAEQVVDRETRAIRTGLTCTLAVGTVFVFACFVGASPSIAYNRIAILATPVVWAGMWIWQSIYARRLSRTTLAS